MWATDDLARHVRRRLHHLVAIRTSDRRHLRWRRRGGWSRQRLGERRRCVRRPGRCGAIRRLPAAGRRRRGRRHGRAWRTRRLIRHLATSPPSICRNRAAAPILIQRSRTAYSESEPILRLSSLRSANDEWSKACRWSASTSGAPRLSGFFRETPERREYAGSGHQRSIDVDSSTAERIDDYHRARATSSKAIAVAPRALRVSQAVSPGVSSVQLVVRPIRDLTKTCAVPLPRTCN